LTQVACDKGLIRLSAAFNNQTFPLKQLNQAFVSSELVRCRFYGYLSFQELNSISTTLLGFEAQLAMFNNGSAFSIERRPSPSLSALACWSKQLLCPHCLVEDITSAIAGETLEETRNSIQYAKLLVYLSSSGRCRDTSQYYWSRFNTDQTNRSR
jgi:hypothetical protein